MRSLSMLVRYESVAAGAQQNVILCSFFFGARKRLSMHIVDMRLVGNLIFLHTFRPPSVLLPSLESVAVISP